MFNKPGTCLLVMCALVVGLSDAAYAQRQAPSFRVDDGPRQTINFTFGLFSPLQDEARTEGDVLVANIDFLAFEFEDFRGGTFGIEWLIPIGNFVEAGAGLSVQRKTVPTVYRDFIETDGTEIEQEISLDQTPLAFTVRVLPAGQGVPVQPYIGGGIVVTRWKYSEIGEFIGANSSIFEAEFEADGWETGPLFVGGIRFAGRSFGAGFEIRRQWAEGELPIEFFGPAIDLGGWTYQGTIGVRF